MDERSEIIGQVLKKYRKSNGYTVPEVSALLLEKYNMNVAEKTIYGWESSQCLPPSQKLLALCELYQITNINHSFGGSPDNRNFGITSLERRVIEEFRLHPEMQQAVCRLLGIEEPNTPGTGHTSHTPTNR